MAKINSFISGATSTNYNGAGTKYPVKTVGGAYYVFYIEVGTTNFVYKKSTDGGKTWANPVIIRTAVGNVVNIAVWYDRWSGIAAGLIHAAYTDNNPDDTFYRSVDTENSDTLSTETTIHAGASAATGGALSIVRARGGNLYCKTTIDAGAEGGFYRSTDVGATWGARTNSEALATTDQWILMPGFAADNQDILMIFWDASADEIDRVAYDDSGDAWTLTNISTGMVDVTAASHYPHFAATPDLTNSQILVVAWNGVDTANQDLLGWTVTESAITAFTTTPVLNATDDCAFAAIAIDTDTEDWYVYYGGKSDGSDTFNSQLSLNYKKSTDDGATWGSETDLIISGSTDAGERIIGVLGLWACPRFNTRQIVEFIAGGVNPYNVASVDEPAASGGLASNMFGGGVVQ